MALTYNQLNAITKKYYMPKLVDNIFDSNALWQRGRKKFYESVSGGETLMCPVLYAATTAAGWYSGAETLNTTDNENITSAEFNWAQAYASITITRLDENKNSGAEQVVNLVKSKVQSAEKTLADNLGTGMFNTGTDSKAIVGLGKIVAIDRTYGGINSTTYSWWDGQVDSTTTTLSIPAMQAINGDCTIDNDRPTVLISDQDVWDDYYGLLQPQQRFQDEDTAKGGFSNLMFNGRPYIVDSHCASGDLYFINENYLSIKYHKDENFRFEPFQKPVNQNVSYARIYWTGALTCSNPRMQGKLDSLT